MRSFRAVAWDVDGTLVDSEPLHHRALLAGSLRWGVDLSDLPEQQFRGTHMADAWAALRPRMPAELGPADWLAAITAYYIANSGDLKPLPGVVPGALAAIVATDKAVFPKSSGGGKIDCVNPFTTPQAVSKRLFVVSGRMRGTVESRPLTRIGLAPVSAVALAREPGPRQAMSPTRPGHWRPLRGCRSSERLDAFRAYSVRPITSSPLAD